MSHSHTKIWIHAIFETKFRQPTLQEDFRQELYDFIRNELRGMNCSTRIINGTEDHIHILFQLNPQKNVADVIKNIKGLSSHWINSKDFLVGKFAWQGGYGAFSVSESAVDKVYRYILNQKEHHQNMSYEEEVNKFIEFKKVINE
jgi:putative transposase